MANHSATKKSIRKTVRRTYINKQIRTQISSLEKHIRQLILKKDKSQAREQFKIFNKVIDRSVSKNILHANKSNRKKSHLSQLINNI